jgi:serine/threonine-protein phosphatase 2A activator
MGAWKKSNLFVELMQFIYEANAAVMGKNIRREFDISQNVRLLCDKLEEMLAWMATIPPIKQAMRFGNKAFRVWHERLEQNCHAFHLELLGEEKAAAVVELQAYFLAAFGSPQRLDYGTGHELCFVTWLTALRKLGVFETRDMEALILAALPRYLSVCRELQTVYWLEPAGSKGVWGLDDYQFLPLLWGAAQLHEAPHDLPPSVIHRPDQVSMYADEYLYLACIQFLMKVKSGGALAEHSPLLNDISQIPSWRKVNQGLFKMYDKEVLGKFPVVQHILFGSILSFDADPRAADLELPGGPPRRRPALPKLDDTQAPG